MFPGADAQARKRERREEVRSRLRAAIREVAADHTFLEVRVDQIAGAAGLSRSAFYFYYADKHKLLIDAAREVADEIYEQAQGWWQGSGDPRELIREALRSNAATFATHADLLRMTMEAATYDEEVRDFWRGIIEQFIAAVAERVRSDQASGATSAEVAADSSAEILVIATEGYLYRNIARGNGSAEHAVEALAPVWTRVLYPAATTG